mgnify:CR=1 FL=1
MKAENILIGWYLLVKSKNKGEYIYMSNLKEKLTKVGATAVIVITILAVCYGLSWIVTCGIIKLITMCFGLTFKWSIATGIWLIICILRSVFNVTVKK